VGIGKGFVVFDNSDSSVVFTDIFAVIVGTELLANSTTRTFVGVYSKSLFHSILPFR